MLLSTTTGAGGAVILMLKVAYKTHDQAGVSWHRTINTASCRMPGSGAETWTMPGQEWSHHHGSQLFKSSKHHLQPDSTDCCHISRRGTCHCDDSVKHPDDLDNALASCQAPASRAVLTLNDGSSKHGNALRAAMDSNCVAAIT